MQIDLVKLEWLMISTVDDFIVVSDSNKFDFENRGFSISSWVKKFSQVNSNVGMVLSQWNTGASPGTNQWLLSSSTSGEIGKPNFSYEVANQTFKSTSSSVMGLNKWIHLVGVRESTHTKLFMNGSLLSQNVGSSGSVNETGRNLYFGKYRDSNSIFSNISIDDARIYSRALSSSEVFALYQFEKPIYFSQVLLFRFSKISRQARKLVIFLCLIRIQILPFFLNWLMETGQIQIMNFL